LQFHDNDDRPDGVHVKGDDPQHASDEEIDECDEEFEEVSEQSRISLPKNLIRPLSVQDH
jgi:hypothetical protein